MDTCSRDLWSKTMLPDYQALFLPTLKHLADGKELSREELSELLAAEFSVTEEERKEMLPSGQQTYLENRAGWAQTYLKKAGLIESPKRKHFRITERGRGVLKSGVASLKSKDLKQFPEFLEFIRPKKLSLPPEALAIDEEAAPETPEERLDNAYQDIRRSMAQELLARVLALHPSAFERLVVELLVNMGYGGSLKDAGKAIGKGGDEGIDGVIKEDRLGLDIIYIQAKRWKPESSVGRPEIQKFIGALAGQGAKKGIFITTAYFTKEARDYTPRNETKIVLIDGEELTQYMMDFNVGCSPLSTYEIKKIDGDYFED